jgi:hypothetical protein
MLNGLVRDDDDSRRAVFEHVITEAVLAAMMCGDEYIGGCQLAAKVRGPLARFQEDLGGGAGNALSAAVYVGSGAAKVGGRGGIRTHGGIAPSLVFKTSSLNRSDTLPHFELTISLLRHYTTRAGGCFLYRPHSIR